MFQIQNYSGFILAIFLFQIIPGAGTIAILNATARQGISGGMRAVYGTLSGDFIYMLSAVLGLAALLAAYPEILYAAQWFGIIYLCWVGCKLLRRSAAERLTSHTPEHDGWSTYRQALAVALTNPKAILFFMAFFPLFLRADSGPLTPFLLMLHVTLISLLYQAGLVLVGHVVAGYLGRWKYARLLATRLAGLALISFGLKLAFNRR